jgi:thymidylate synthase (FAD)
MAETTVKIKLLAHTQLSEKFLEELSAIEWFSNTGFISDGQAVALSAIRTCYSPNKPSEIVAKEGDKYFRKAATDGEGGTEADRLIRHIMRSGHTSTTEHITFTFAIEGISRALLAQLTRHRVGFSFSVQSQRYVRMGSDDKIGGMDYVKPESVTTEKILSEKKYEERFENYLSAPTREWYSADLIFSKAMENAQHYYDELRLLGVSPEDARSVLPNAAATNLVMTANLRALIDFYSKRRSGRGAQSEICTLAESLRREVESVEPWTTKFFEEA